MPKGSSFECDECKKETELLRCRVLLKTGRGPNLPVVTSVRILCSDCLASYTTDDGAWDELSRLTGPKHVADTMIVWLHQFDWPRPALDKLLEIAWWGVGQTESRSLMASELAKRVRG